MAYNGMVSADFLGILCGCITFDAHQSVSQYMENGERILSYLFDLDAVDAVSRCAYQNSSHAIQMLSRT